MEWKVSSWKRISSIQLWGEEEIPQSAVEIGFHTKTKREINSPWDAARSIHGGMAREGEAKGEVEDEEEEEVDEATKEWDWGERFKGASEG